MFGHLLTIVFGCVFGFSLFVFAMDKVSDNAKMCLLLLRLYLHRLRHRRLLLLLMCLLADPAPAASIG